MRNTTTRSNLGREGFNWHTLPHHSLLTGDIRAATQGGNLEAGTEEEILQKCCLLTYMALLSYLPRTTCPRVAPPTVGGVLPQGSASQACQSVRNTFEAPSSGMTLACVKLAENLPAQLWALVGPPSLPSSQPRRSSFIWSTERLFSSARLVVPQTFLWTQKPNWQVSYLAVLLIWTLATKSRNHLQSGRDNLLWLRPEKGARSRD